MKSNRRPRKNLRHCGHRIESLESRELLDGSGLLAATLIGAPYDTHNVLLADFNGDGNVDIAAIVNNEYAPEGLSRVFQNDGRGNFSPVGNSFGPTSHSSAAIADFDGDGAVDIAIDPGMIINPDRVRAQCEGAVVFGASLALMGEITAAGGKVQQSNFHNYPVARMNDAPIETHVHIVPSTAPPAGVGEPGVPPVAPAICNAIFAATGKRIRELPIKRTKLA